ncbi:metallo-beta-lactamase superfamily protein [Diaporthe helianthi]|uniref:Atrochrysone carboxyl ACP thioesterase n=1 Tax=Diaporthe helianthi TaxID=158607 RepID=DHTE_DIAHE|nr:metallo-beta-lactamase superfamily protein [Diaporthe helianthi]
MVGVGGYQQINKAFNVCAFEDYLATQQKSLPRLKNVEQITPRVIRILGQNPGKFTLQGTNTYIVGTGPSRLLIDTAQGIPEWADIIAKTLRELGITLSHVLLTHWHGDHTGGVPDLLRLYPHLSEAIYKNSPARDQLPILDGQLFEVEGATIRAFHSPGHSHDHMCFILEDENAMFTGDNILGHGTSAVENLGLLMTTWRHMLTQECKLGYPAHGAVVPNLPLKIKGELAGKTRRERQVLETLRSLRKDGGARGKRATITVKQLVLMMHGEAVNEEVRIMALEPFMEEVLRKLAEDGQVGFEMRGGEKKWFGLLN